LKTGASFYSCESVRTLAIQTEVAANFKANYFVLIVYSVCFSGNGASKDGYVQ